MTAIEVYMLLRDEWEEMDDGPVKKAMYKALKILSREIRGFAGQLENETVADWAERTGKTGLEVHTCPHCQQKTFVNSRRREDVATRHVTCSECGADFLATDITHSHTNFVRCTHTGFTMRYE